jgi:hypothetical protein
MATQQLSLAQLQGVVNGLENALSRVRSISSELQQQIASLDRVRYSDRFIADETARLRQAAGQQAKDFLAQEEFAAHVDLAVAQDWSTETFLIRTLSEQLQAKASGETAFILSRVSTGLLVPLADTAIANAEWDTLALAYAETSGRAEQPNNDAAVSLLARMRAADIPALQEGKEMVSRAKKMSEYVRYSMEFISGSRDRDLGVALESYAAMAEEQAHAQYELDREGSVVQFQRGEVPQSA